MTCLLRRLRRGTRTSGARTCGGCVDVYILWLLGAVCIAHGVFGRAAAPWLSARCTLLRSCRQWASRSCYQRYGRVCMLYVLPLLGARLVATTGQHSHAPHAGWAHETVLRHRPLVVLCWSNHRCRRPRQWCSTYGLQACAVCVARHRAGGLRRLRAHAQRVGDHGKPLGRWHWCWYVCHRMWRQRISVHASWDGVT